MYKVICYFTDLQDFNHPYDEGDIFPRQGVTVSQERLNELASSKNKRGKPLIKLVEEVKEVETPTEKVATVEYTKTIINRMSKDDLVALAIEQGIENAKETSGADLKKALIEKFGL